MANILIVDDSSHVRKQHEVYIAERSYARFSHCICNECRSITYPDLD